MRATLTGATIGGASESSGPSEQRAHNTILEPTSPLMPRSIVPAFRLPRLFMARWCPLVMGV